MLLNRRQFIQAAAGLMASLALPLPSLGAESPVESEDIIWGAPEGVEPAWNVVEFTREQYNYPLYGYVDGRYRQVAMIPGMGTCQLTVERTWGNTKEDREYLFTEEEMQYVFAAESWDEMELRLLAKMDEDHMANWSAKGMGT